MKDTLEFIVASIINTPDEVKVEEENVEGGVNLTIHVPKEEMGKVIGKEGKVIRSIRNIMKIKAMKHGVRINIMLADQQ